MALSLSDNVFVVSPVSPAKCINLFISLSLEVRFEYRQMVYLNAIAALTAFFQPPYKSARS